MGAASKVPLEQFDHAAPSHKWLIAMAVMLGTALEVLDTSIVNVALPHMQGTFSASVDEIAWVLTSYLIANGIMIPMTGWISARFGRKRYFLTSVAVFVVASGLCGAARSLDQMVIFRLIQGAAGAAMIPSSQAILMETFPPNEQQLAMATWGMGLMVAPIMGPTLGGWITDNWNWRWNFYINLPVGLIAFLMVSAFVHDPAYLRAHRARGGKVDYLGMILLAVSLGLMQIVLDRGQRADWFASSWVVYSVVISLALFTWFVIHELCFEEPILDLRILKIPIFSFSVALMVAMLLVGQLSRAGFDTRPLIGLGFVGMTAGLWQMSRWDLQVSTWVVVWPSIVMGIGMGMIFPTLSAITLSCVQRERMGYAASLYNMMRNAGAAIGISYMTTALVSHEQVHQSYLAERFSVFAAWKMSAAGAQLPGAHAFHFVPQLITGQKQGIGGVYAMIQAQAAMLSFNDIYRTLAIVMLILVPSFIVLRRAQAGAGGAAH